MNPSSAPHPSAALVVISGGPETGGRRTSARPPTARLLKALPRAGRVLQIGDDGGALQREYCARHPGCEWVATPGLPGEPMPPFDAIVLACALQTLEDPLASLRALAAWADARTQLVLDIANEASFATLRRIAEGDLTEAVDGAGSSVAFASPASLYKLLMDAGWMPTVADAGAATPKADAASAACLSLAEALGVPRATAQRTLGLQRLAVRAQRGFDAAPAEAGPARFAVVVPTTRENQLRLNVECSPGLREVGARIVSYRHAASPADALQGSLQHVQEDWVLLCHQDVYFPAGFGERLNALLAQVPPGERARTLIGFAGMGVNRQTHAYEKAGFVIDRLHRFDHPASDAAVSIDELALVVARDSVHRIDPRMGWHLWATELCLAAICEHQVFPRIVRLPLFHNSLNDYQLPGSFYESAEKLMAKYPGFGPIATLCGTLDAQFLAQAGRSER
ncbi:MAG: hypothetical protein AB1430_17840 [Pseudomonadota bacterium]